MVASNDFLKEKHEMATICMAFYRRRLAHAYNGSKHGKTSNDQHSRPGVVNHARLGENLYRWEVRANLGKSIQGY